MVARVGEVVAENRGELDQIPFGVDHRAHEFVDRLVLDVVDELEGVVEIVGAVEPLCRDEERHGEVFLAVRCGTRVHHGKFGGGNLPGEVALVRAIGVVQVPAREGPKFLEHFGVVCQSRYEHPVAHALGTDIVVTNVDNVRHVVGGVETDSLVDGVAFKKLTISIVNELVTKVWTIARFNKKVAGLKTLLHSVNIYIQWVRERL